jgi:hypothetical protein
MRHRYLSFAAVVALALLVTPAVAQARAVLFSGPHPVAPRLSKAMCYIEGPHVHSYLPHKLTLYVKVKARYVFVGDPVEFEEKAPRYSYYGHHPAFWVKGGGKHYCYITGPHHHWYRPPVSLRARFKMKGGVRWYVGGHPKWYRPKHWRARALDRHYGRVKFARPVVRVGPPFGFVGVVIRPPKVRGHIEVRGPGVGVEVKVKLPFGIKVGKHRGRGHGRGHGSWRGKGHYKHRWKHKRGKGRKGGMWKGRRKHKW